MRNKQISSPTYCDYWLICLDDTCEWYVSFNPIRCQKYNLYVIFDTLTDQESTHGQIKYKVILHCCHLHEFLLHVAGKYTQQWPSQRGGTVPWQKPCRPPLAPNEITHCTKGYGEPPRPAILSPSQPPLLTPEPPLPPPHFEKSGYAPDTQSQVWLERAWGKCSPFPLSLWAIPHATFRKFS